MARKINTDMLRNYAADSYQEDRESKKISNVSPRSIANLHKRTDGKSPTKYMQINVFEYEDYLYRMARYHKKTTTKYILSLIEKDAAEHEEEYTALKKLPEFNKPHRESPNRKKSV